MEIELKYFIKDESTMEVIWNDKELKGLEDPNTREIEEYNGIYYDTLDYILFKNDIAFRIRREGSKVIASLKWKGQAKGALHTREELNVSLGEEEEMPSPNPEIFKESEIGAELISLLAGKDLKPMIWVNVIRKSFRIEKDDNLMEISIDSGEISTSNGSEALCELEIELFSGEKEGLISFGEDLQKKYNLQAEKRSKFARGLMLLKIINQ